jgi:hypothetical protein
LGVRGGVGLLGVRLRVRFAVRRGVGLLRVRGGVGLRLARGGGGRRRGRFISPKVGTSLLLEGDVVKEGLALGLPPGLELVFHILDLNGLAWLLNGGVGVNFLEGSDLGGDLLEGWELPALNSNVPGISGNGDEGLERRVGSSTASKVHENGLALVQWIGVVQLDGRVSHIKSSRANAVGKVDVLDHKDQTLIRVAELLGLGRDVHLPGQSWKLILKLFRGRGGGFFVGGGVGLFGVGFGIRGRVGAGFAGRG